MFVGQFITDLKGVSVAFNRVEKVFEAKGRFLFQDPIYCGQLRLLKMLTFVPLSEYPTRLILFQYSNTILKFFGLLFLH